MEKPVDWIGSSLDDLREFPKPVKAAVGHALKKAQSGEKSLHAKPLKEFKGAGVLEIFEDFDGDTYRAVYTVRFSRIVYVLHCFQKKSKRDIETNKSDIELVKQRLKLAEKNHKEQK